jgi:hypothetical protein
MLVTNIQTLQKYAPEFTGGVTFANVETLIKTVIREEVYPIFGKTYADAATGELKDLLEEAVCNLLAFRKIKRHSINFTGSGTQKFENQNFVSPYKYEKADFKEEAVLNGYMALEAALKLAFQDTAFQTKEEYFEARARFINFTSEVKSYKLDFLTFRTLFPVLELIEREVLKPLLGATLYTEMLGKQYQTFTTQAVKKKELLKLIREGLGMYAVQLALEMGTVQIQGNQVFIKEYKDDDSSYQMKMPRADLYDAALRNRNEYAHRYFNQVNIFLTDNATELGWTAPEAVAATNNYQNQKLKSL